MPFTKQQFRIMLFKFIASSKAHKIEMEEYVIQEKIILEGMKDEMREKIQNKEDIKEDMYYLKQHKLNYNFMENRYIFWKACENIDTETILEYHQKCVEWEDHAVECVTDSSISCSSLNLETNTNAFNEESTLNICNSMKLSRDSREKMLECLQMIEMGREMYFP